MTERGQDHSAPDPQWYRDGVIYELAVRAFADSNGDGVGDFGGLTSRLDYLEELGVTALWLLPFYPSPGRDDGYDIAHYTSVNPAYGDMRSFKRFLRDAHQRDIKVITELVVNHTSDQHEWFQKARNAPPGSPWRDFYMWSDTPDRYGDARIIFQDFETSNWTWDPVAGAYYFHRFYSHQPDLNYDNPAVQAAIIKVLDFWLGLGVDGLRLDAVPYLFAREGTNCENLPETHGFLRDLRAHVDANYEGRMLLAEANQWPEDAAAYFGNGDECHMNFHFPVMPRLYMALHTESRMPIVDILEQTPEIPDGCQWATFLRNHDELTLEMVTDEERDSMYRAYARDPEMRINLGIRRRLAPLLENDRRKIELLNAVLYSLPGTPVMYYGDEIGLGDNVYLGDRDGVRTPMQWTPDRNAGFSSASPQRLYLPLVVEPGYHYESVNVEAQAANPSSLLWWMRQLVALRKRHRVLGRGTIRFLEPENHRVLAFVRELDGHPPMLVVANLSRLAQQVELDLHEFLGAEPMEIFGHTRFAPIGELPYYVTLAPYGFFWFSLESRPASEEGADADEGAPHLGERWAELLADPTPELLGAVERFVVRRRWFAGKSRVIRRVAVEDAVTVPAGGDTALPVSILFVGIDYVDSAHETYQVPVVLVPTDHAADLVTYRPDAVIAFTPDGVLVDAMSHEPSVAALTRLAGGRRTLRGQRALLRPGLDLPPRPALGAEPSVHLLSAEQSNSSAVVDDAAVFKLVRRLDEGRNPELELGRFLSEEARFGAVPAVIGSLEVERHRGRWDTTAVVTAWVPNEGDAWSLTLDELGRFYDRAFSRGHELPPAPGGSTLVERAASDVPDDVADLLGGFRDQVTLLGVRTAELHRALGSGSSVDLRPERFTALYQRSLYQSLRGRLRASLRALRQARRRLDGDLAVLADRVLASEPALMDQIDEIRRDRIMTSRIRIHGDLHLGQILMSGQEPVFIDFEGEPRRPIGERRIKRSPFADVAGMVRSIDYAAHVGARTQDERGRLHALRPEEVEAWTGWWADWMSVSFLQGYLPVLADSGLIPEGRADCDRLLRFHLLDKACYELAYELDARPDWVDVPLKGLDRLRAEGAT